MQLTVIGHSVDFLDELDILVNHLLRPQGKKMFPIASNYLMVSVCQSLQYIQVI